MAAHKGHKKYGGGSRKGKPNRQTVTVKQAFIDAFDNLGGVPALVKWGTANPTEFYKLYSKLIPQDITSGGEKLSLNVIYGK